MSDSAVKGDVYLPVLCGGTLDALAADGAVAQSVRGCSATAVIDAIEDIDYWDVILEDQTVPQELCVVLVSVAGYAHNPPYYPSWEWNGQGNLRISAFHNDDEAGFEQTLSETICFTVLHIPNR